MEAGTKLDPKVMQVECPSCGGACNLSVTKNMTVFAWCTEKFEDGEKCCYRGFLGRRKSRELIKEYKALEGKKDVQNTDSTTETERSGDDRAGEHNRHGHDGVPEEVNPEGRGSEDKAKSIGAAFFGGLLGGDSGSAFD